MKHPRVLILAKVDCAGSGQRFADALRSQGVHATMVAERYSAYGYQVDVCAPDVADLQRMVNRADVVHLKGDHLPKDWHQLRMHHKPVVITAGGSGFRRNHGLPRCYAQQWHPLAEYLLAVDAIGVLTPDLMYQGLHATWTPHATAVWPLWRKPQGTILIGHSPSDRRSKGTDSVVVPAVTMLKMMGWPVELVTMEGMTNYECLRQKKQCHLFFDQAAIPSYGLSAVEALAMGIPVVQYMTEEVRLRHEALGEGCPLITFDVPTPEAAATAIDEALTSHTWNRLHQRTLAYVREVHGYAPVVKQLRALYQRALHNRV